MWISGGQARAPARALSPPRPKIIARDEGLAEYLFCRFCHPPPRWGADNGRTGQARPAGARTNQATPARLRQGGYVVCFSHLLRTPASTTRAAYSGAKEALMRIFKKLICMSDVLFVFGGGV